MIKTDTYFGQEEWLMIKQIAWNTFKNTGNIDTFLELKQVIDMEEDMRESVYENGEDKWSNNSRKDGSRF